MPDSLKFYLLRLAAGACIVLGLLAVVIAYLGVRDLADVVLQVPYAVSGGLGGLALVMVGAVLLLGNHVREQARHNAEVVEALEEWKESALAEIRGFLEGATIEVDLTQASRTTSNGKAGGASGRRRAAAK